MELADICDGCSRHVAVCMCGMRSGSNGIEVSRPNPATLADKLRIIAQSRKVQELDTKNTTISERIIAKATLAAKEGKMSINFWYSEFELNDELANMISTNLTLQGFKCDVYSEITDWYSNTDFDSKQRMTVSWANKIL